MSTPKLQMGNAADKEAVKRSMDKQIGEQHVQNGEPNELAPLMMHESQPEGLRHRKPKPSFNPNAKPFVPITFQAQAHIEPPVAPTMPPAVPTKEPETLALTNSTFGSDVPKVVIEEPKVVEPPKVEETKIPPQLVIPRQRPQRAFTDITATTFGTSPVDPVHYREYTKKMMDLAEKKKATFLFDIECYPPEIMKERLCICTYRKGNMVINTEAQHETEELAIEMAAKQMWEILK